MSDRQTLLFEEAPPAAEFDCLRKRVVPALPMAPFARHSETSRAAAIAQTGSNRLLDMARIYHLVKSREEYGCTCDEAEVILKMSHQTCSARFSEMSDAEKGLPMQLVWTPRVRKTRTGCKAGVYVVKGENG